MIDPSKGSVLCCALLAAASGPAGATDPGLFACSVIGEKRVTPPVSATSICARFRASLAQAAGRVPAPISRVTLTFTKTGVASARIERPQRRRVMVQADFSVAVSDRPIGLQDVDLLARNVARAIDAANGRS